MVLLTWKAEFDLGVASMDQEHRNLVAAMNKVHELDAQGAGKAQVDAALQRLMSLTAEHFADEERYMDTVGFADTRRHKMIHQDMLRQVGEHYETFRQGDGRVGKRFFDFLVHWLAAHICHIDRKYAEMPVPARGGR